MRNYLNRFLLVNLVISVFFCGCASIKEQPVSSASNSVCDGISKNTSDILNQDEIKMVEAILLKLEPLVSEKTKNGLMPLLNFEELYVPLNAKDKEFLQLFLNLDAKKLGVVLPYRGFAQKDTKFVALQGQIVKDAQGNPKKIDGQFLPQEVYRHYMQMIGAMKKDIGKVLYVESGYRSLAHQLYLFLYYLKKHHYSVRETAQFVAIVGYSEHGAPEYQALDFINSDGINGEDNPEQFENLVEYKWLQNNASKFGFVLSYPRNSPSGITFEPWHWRFDKSANLSCQ